jgi:caffeoyl-CoA O-methyltransferase
MARTSIMATPELNEYLVAHGTPPDQLQRELIAETAELGGVATMQIAPEQGAFLTLLTGLIGVRSAVEVGTFTGYSSLAIARGLPDGGRLLCCDVSDEWTSVAHRYWQRAGVADRIELRIAPAIETLRALPDDASIDLVFMDADKGGYIAYWEELVPRVRQNGLLVVDNVLYHGEVLDPANARDSGRAIHEFNEHVIADDRVELVMLPVGDGLTLARKR